MELQNFHYTDKKGKESDRLVYPIGLVDDKLFAIDLTEYDEEEREDYKVILDAIHAQTVQAIKDAGMGSNFRYFFIRNIK